MTVGRRIVLLRESREINQKELAEKVGLNISVMNRIENGLRPLRDDEAVKIAEIFHVSTDYLLTGKDTIKKESPHQGVKIPVVGKVVAGIPLEAIQESDIVDYEEIPQSMAATGTFFALRASGSSMEPTLRDGDTVIVKQQPDVDSGNIAIVLVNGNDATIKEVQKSREGITLVGHNVAAYSPHFYSNAEIESLPVRIIGRVVESRRKF